VTAGGTATANFGIQQKPTLFDPPSGRKTVDASGFPVIEWRVIWINDSNTVANRVRVIDPIPTGASYDPDSLRCEARGQSTVATCVFEPANNQIVYEGDIAADPGASDEADAQNEVVIVFTTRLRPGVKSAENLAIAYWDRNGDGDVEDDIAGGQKPVETNDGIPTPTPPIQRSRVDAILFPYFVVSDTVTSLVSVINRAGVDPNSNRLHTLHYTAYYKRGPNA
jgi:uncharacterized repeat protein (TIGR01451 family)